MFDIDDEIEDKRNGYVDDIFGTVDNLEKERGRNEWHLGRNVANELELDNSRTDMSPEDTKKEIDKIRRMERPDMPIKTKSRHRYKWQQQMPNRLKIY